MRKHWPTDSKPPSPSNIQASQKASKRAPAALIHSPKADSVMVVSSKTTD